jgi:hypothetical protein
MSSPARPLSFPADFRYVARPMRGSRQPALRPQPTDPQTKVSALSRHRRTKVARAAHTTLLKVDQWGRGDGVGAELSAAIERAVLASSEKKGK